MKQKNKLIIVSIFIILISTLFLTTKVLASSFDTSGTSSSEFHYEGTPSTSGSYVASDSNYGDENVIATESVAYYINKVLTTLQGIFVLIIIICLLKASQNMRKNSMIEDESLEGDETAQNNKKPVLGYFCVAGTFVALYGVFNIVKGFAQNQ